MWFSCARRLAGDLSFYDDQFIFRLAAPDIRWHRIRHAAIKEHTFDWSHARFKKAPHHSRNCGSW